MQRRHQGVCGRMVGLVPVHGDALLRGLDEDTGLGDAFEHRLVLERT